ncbi:amidohydrolase [Phytohabitans rumicis]|uniref:Amidohydrolase n=1 Tax=Phytohabitans rumicis TaxID=1076125 RepID=A0A6V8LQB2_9ACTN|nr:amidohydrolase family protein [Phytohabitans rumicis]GFJ96297.1 amidohydrolase [Phytohabitans rumicis]
MDVLLRRVRAGLGGPLVDVRLAGGVVAAIGTGEPAGGARVIDARGGTLLPGLVDAHVHAAQWASHRRRVPLDAATSARAVVDLLANQPPAGPGEVLMGAGFRDGLWPDAPHKDLLERALPGQPVALFSADLHTLWLSPAALRLIGWEHPTGVLVENDCYEATSALPAAPVELLDRWVLEAAAAAAARGVTGIRDFEYADTVTDWTRRLAAGPPAVRVECVIARPVLDDAIARGHRTGDPIGETDGLLTVGPYKLFVDGSLNTRTAYCHDPYPGTAFHGRLELPPEELVPLMDRAYRHGILPAVHAIGDHATAIALDAFARVGCPGRIEHAQLVHPGDLARFAALDLTVGVQPAHAPDDRDVADRHWAGRTGRAFPYADLLAAGARLEIGSDAPVSPLDPWDGIASAVTRSDDGRPSWHPEQAIPLAEALRAASGGRAGVRVGDPADLIVVGTDPGEVAPQDLRHIPVTATFLAGRPTHLAA